MAAVRANTMQTITSKRILGDGQPFAATISAPRANGRAKIVCEKRINRRNRPTAPFPNCLIISRRELLVVPNTDCEPIVFGRFAAARLSSGKVHKRLRLYSTQWGAGLRHLGSKKQTPNQ